ncbi:actin-related protein 6-like [Tubulanus polymorphus]|uniref:actin-related protein 6-like n=1 Tax=Tubulanus polymorphus TaxID=672921 RepID=UPI003DA4402B
MPVLVLDNGAWTAKVGYATDNEPRIIPNCVIKAKNVRTRVFTGSQIDDCKDMSGLYYLLAFQKGYLTNWEVEKQVWDHVFGKDCFKVNFEETTALVTEPFFNFLSVQEAMNEVLFEEYQFASIYRTNAGYLSQYRHNKTSNKKHKCTLIVDTGFSFTHVVPYYNGKKVKGPIRRLTIGGKILTNHLKEVISYRQLMVMDETHVMNQCKEDVCYVSQDFYHDMNIAKKRWPENTVVRDYILPDYTHIKRGYMRSAEESTGKAAGSEQIIRLNNERFAIPELLFHPSDVGIQETGIPEAIVESINATPTEMRPHFYGDILLTGGNCLLPGFKDRILKDVRSMAPADYDINIRLPDDPITYSWHGGAQLAQTPDFKKLCVTREQYEEHGPNICEERFDV